MHLSGYALRNKVLIQEEDPGCQPKASRYLNRPKRSRKSQKEAELEGKDMILRLAGFRDQDSKPARRTDCLKKRLSLKEDNVDRRLALLEKRKRNWMLNMTP